MDVDSFLGRLETLPSYQGQMVHVQHVPPREPVYGDLDPPLNARLSEALREMGVDSLYSHQAEAVDALRRGANVVVATAAASGKSMCYHLPVLEALMEDRGSTALYLFPTKALAQDQSRTLATLVGDGRGPRHGIFDGDTPPQDRADVRRYAQLVVTNPDMLHLGILPNHRSWRRFLRGLRYVVVDEAHAFRGVFGSHVANVLRRLRRLCAKMRASPQFVLCSATIANPGEHAERLAGLPFRVVDEDGAPSGGRDFVFWNPPVIDEGRGRRRSSNTEATALFTELVRREVRTLAFVRSRKMAELLYVYARDKLGEEGGGLAERIAPYRGTYLPEDRRRIERDMFQGRLLGLTTTNAMELGIDIGDLDATIWPDTPAASPAPGSRRAAAAGAASAP